jgi:hypothetical protein
MGNVCIGNRHQSRPAHQQRVDGLVQRLVLPVVLHQEALNVEGERERHLQNKVGAGLWQLAESQTRHHWPRLPERMPTA